MEEQRDLVVFSDDEGNEFELEIVDYFDYEGQEYAVLVDPESGCGCGCGCECDDDECGDKEEHEHGSEVYIMKIVTRLNGELIRRFGDNYALLRDIFSDQEVTR